MNFLGSAAGLPFLSGCLDNDDASLLAGDSTRKHGRGLMRRRGRVLTPRPAANEWRSNRHRARCGRPMGRDQRPVRRSLHEDGQLVGSTSFNLVFGS